MLQVIYGYPFADIADKTDLDSIIAIEVSSFQLETIKEFRPKVAAILNITEDHLNRHKTMERYIECKFKICENQSAGDYLILNIDDRNITEYVKTHKIESAINVIWFSTKLLKDKLKEEVDKINRERYEYRLKSKKFENDQEKSSWIEKYGKNILKENYIYTEGKSIYLVLANEEKELLKVADINLLGDHNIENVMVSIAAAYLLGIEECYIKNAIKNFKAVEHRIEYVDEIDGIKYYNDSKATNPDSTIKAIKAMKEKTILLLGGSNKNSDYTDIFKQENNNIYMYVIYGETKDQLKRDIDKVGKTNYIMVENLKEAILEAKKKLNGDKGCILLSPACASFDEYSGYEERGRHFKKIVSDIKEGKI